MVADGSVRTITEADGDLMEAARLSVGFLGVMVELTLKVVKDRVVHRSLAYIDDQDLLWDLKQAEKNVLAYDTVQYWYAPAIRTASRATGMGTPDAVTSVTTAVCPDAPTASTSSASTSRP